MSLLERQTEYTSYLVSGFPELGLRGWHLAGACAVTGNATQENLCKPVTLGTKDHGSDGILQWRLSRLVELKAWCGSHFGEWRTLRAQAAFTLFETARDYPNLDAELRKSMDGVAADDVRRALDYKTAEFCWVFERPKKGPTAGMLNRQRHAASVYMIMSEETVMAAPKPGISPATGTVIIGAGAAATTAGTMAVENGATSTGSIVSLIAFLVISVIAMYMSRKKTVAPEVVLQLPSEAFPFISPFDELTAALEALSIAKARVAEAADAMRERRAEEDDMLGASDGPTIEHQPSLPLGGMEDTVDFPHP